MSKTQEIDISKILREKSPRLSAFIPNFIVRKIKQLVHEKEINQILKNLENKKGMDFVKGGLSELNVKSSSIGFEKIPRDEGIIIVANHPLGGLDGVALINELGKFRNDIKFLVNDILTQIKSFDDFFIPISKHGANSRENLNSIDQLYQSNKCIVIFPAGLVSRENKKQVQDLEWKKSFITKAKKNNKSIYPVFVSGKNSNKFYKTAYWRKKLGIKLNMEMFLLVDEMFKQKGNTIKFTMGNPIKAKELTAEKTNHEWAQKIRSHVYKIENNPNFEFKDTLTNE